jgi:hypothetical protein
MRQLVVFTEDNALIETVKNCINEDACKFFSFRHNLADLDLSNKVTIVDFDSMETDYDNLVQNLVVRSVDGKVILLSLNCERKNINLAARMGVDRFVVKPLNKKRFKNIILPYLGVVSDSSSVVPSPSDSN